MIAAARDTGQAARSSVAMRVQRPGAYADPYLAGVGIGVSAHHSGLPQGLVSRPVEGAALTHEINLTTKRGRLYSPPVKAFVDLALKPRSLARAAVPVA